MAGETTKGASRILVPRWAIIAGVATLVVIAGLVGALVMMKSQTSKTNQILQQAFGPDNSQQALRAEKPIHPINPVQANYTPGTYTKADPGAMDGAKIASSFVFLALGGELNEARKLYDPEVLKERTYLDYLAELRARRGFIDNPETIKVQPLRFVERWGKGRLDAFPGAEVPETYSIGPSQEVIAPLSVTVTDGKTAWEKDAWVYMQLSIKNEWKILAFEIH